VFRAERLSKRRPPPAGAITEPERRVPLFRDCDVPVAGGGPAGTVAAIAAARAGADVVLIERHNHLGGLSTADHQHLGNKSDANSLSLAVGELDQAG
jgi:NADPH-dependent 2,4-dienoyl-CoA reductase/sulfur reductase-like enzyme